jgi:hypothetical protein
MNTIKLSRFVNASLWQAVSYRALNKEKGYDETLHHLLNDVGK